MSFHVPELLGGGSGLVAFFGWSSLLYVSTLT